MSGISPRTRWLFLALGLAVGAPLLRAAPPMTTEALQGMVMAAYRAGSKQVRIPAGTYRLDVPEGVRFCLTFYQLKDFEIDATGVEFLSTDRAAGVILFDRCEGVTFRGAVIRHDPPPFSQGSIEAVSDRSLDVRVAEGYPEDLDDERYFAARDTILSIFHPATRSRKAGTRDLFPSRFERVERGLFRFHFDSPIADSGPVQEGELAAWRGRPVPDVLLDHCARMSMVDLRIENGSGFCLHESGGAGGNAYLRCTVTRAPTPPGAQEEPLFSANADAFHSSNVRRGPVLEDCVFEYMDDDGIAIHGTYALTVSDPGRVVLATMVKDFCEAGDDLRFYTPDGAARGTAKVLEVLPVPDFQVAFTEKDMVKDYRGERPVSFVGLRLSAPVEPGWLVANAQATGSGFAIRRCRIRDHRARGLLIKAGGGVIEDCLIEGSTMAGIAVGPEIFHWKESDYAREVAIRRNTIRFVAIWSDPGNPIAGALTVAASERGQYLPAAGAHREIVIEGNRFENNNGVNLLISSASHVLVKGNVFVDPMREPSTRGQKHGVDPQSLIWVRQSRDVRIEGTVVERPGAFLKSEVDAAPEALAR